jgi:hypothetical protein
MRNMLAGEMNASAAFWATEITRKPAFRRVNFGKAVKFAHPDARYIKE